MSDDAHRLDPRWGLLEDLHAEHALERLSAQPLEQQRQALRDAGMDPDRPRQILEDMLKKVGVAAPTAAAPAARPAAAPVPAPVAPASNVTSLAAARDRRRTWALLAVAAACGGLFLGREPVSGVVLPLPRPSPYPVTLAPPSPARLAELHREDAVMACSRHDWSLCYAHLMRADALDPSGGHTMGVKRMMADASRGLAKEKVAQAAIACRDAKWDVCRQLLKDATALDPNAADDPEVKRLVAAADIGVADSNLREVYGKGAR